MKSRLACHRAGGGGGGEEASTLSHLVMEVALLGTFQSQPNEKPISPSLRGGKGGEVSAPSLRLIVNSPMRKARLSLIRIPVEADTSMKAQFASDANLFASSREICLPSASHLFPTIRTAISRVSLFFTPQISFTNDSISSKLDLCVEGTVRK